MEEGHYTEDNVSGSEYHEFPENQEARSRDRQSIRQDNGRGFRTQGGVKPKLNIGAAGLKMMSTVLTATTVVMVSLVLSEGTFMPGLGEPVQSVAQALERPMVEVQTGISVQQLAQMWENASQGDGAQGESGSAGSSEESGGSSGTSGDSGSGIGDGGEMGPDGSDDGSAPEGDIAAPGENEDGESAEENDGKNNEDNEEGGQEDDQADVQKPHIHSYRWTVSAPAGCVTAGKETGTCACGATTTRTLPAIGHTAVQDSPVAADCTTPSKTAGSHCSTCGKILAAQSVIPARGHTEEELSAVEATCTEPGCGAGSRCSVCGEALVAQETIPFQGRTWEYKPIENDANRHQTVCKVCGATANGANHSFTYTQLDANDHTKTCPTCNYEETEAHTFANGTCTLCGASSGAAQSIAFVAEPLLDLPNGNGTAVMISGMLDIQGVSGTVAGTVGNITFSDPTATWVPMWNATAVDIAQDTYTFEFTLEAQSNGTSIPTGVGDTTFTLTIACGGYTQDFTLTFNWNGSTVTWVTVF